MIKILKRLSKKEWWLVLLCVFLIVGQVYLDLTIPDFMSEITTVIQEHGAVSEVLTNGAKMLGCALGSFVLAVAVSYIATYIGTRLSQRLRSQIYDNVASFSSREMNLFHTSSLITRSTNDITQIQQVVSVVDLMIKAPILAVWATLKIISKSWQWSLATIIVVVILILGASIIISLIVPKFKIMQKQTDDLNRVTTENLNGTRVVKAFNAENFVEKKFDKANTNLKKTNLFTGYTLSFLNPLMNLILNGLSVSIYVIGANLINSAVTVTAKISLFSDMVAFFSYVMQIVSAFIMLVMIFMILPRAQVSAKRVEEVLSTKSSIVDGRGVVPKEKGTVRFENVSFSYEDAKEMVIKNINFEVKSGEMCAIIGATGCGKTTIIQLIPRMYDVSKGAVLVDGENVKDYVLSDLHDKIGFISQRAVLFSGTVESNIALGEVKGAKVKNEMVDEAIDLSQSREFVDTMEQKTQSCINQMGTNVSGGQKQRLAIARALARKPEILIFDDSFSALDYQTDKNLRRILRQELHNTTSIIVAQRIGTIKDCDKIIVVDAGEIVGMGKHEELLKTCEVYKEIALSQMSKEELENAK
jgi:ATP-binding cassette subfamily B protein